MKSSIFRIGISALFICIFAYLIRGDLPGIIATIKSTDLTLFLTGAALFGTSIIFLVKRLELVFCAEDTPIRFRQSLEITLVGFFFNNFLPTAVGGDLVKAYCGSRITRHGLKALTSVLMDRLFGLFIFVLIPSFTVLLLADELDPKIPAMIYALLGGSLVFFLFLFNRPLARRFNFVVAALNRVRLGEKLVMLYDGMHHFRRHKKLLPPVLLLSIGGQILSIGSVYFFIRALGQDINILKVYLLVPVVHITSMLPSLNGLGVREGAFVYFFKHAIGIHAASALAVLYLFILLVMSLLGGAVYLARHDYHFRLGEIAGALKTP